MITLVLDNVTYYYNILISAISIYLDKPNCKSPPSLDFRHSKLCIKGADQTGTFMGLKCVVYYANYRSGH